MIDPRLPDVLAGPILRRLEPRRLVLSLVTTRPQVLQLTLFEEQPQGHSANRTMTLSEEHYQHLTLGKHAHLYLIDVSLDTPLPQDSLIGYDILLGDQETASISQWAPHLCYPGQRRPTFVLTSHHRRLLYGSCRKPHAPGKDGLARADALIAEAPEQPAHRPALMVHCGDQIYTDDVASPMLTAIQSLIEILGLWQESLPEATIGNSNKLASHPDNFHRERLLPAVRDSRQVRERFFAGAEKPVFTSDHAHRHLISLAEITAMYLMVWSPTPWTLVHPVVPEMTAADREEYLRQQPEIDAFVEQLPAAARLLAHLPNVMIFDDHDVSDDWNMTAAWEETAYGHPFSHRIIGNAILGYLLFQGWGNQPESVAELMPSIHNLLNQAKAEQELDSDHQFNVIEQLRHFENWHFQLAGAPPVVVLDTRTRRWRSERRAQRPSGLMDWEALSEFQQQLLGQKAAIIVSPTPIFGVKLIESIQRVMTLFGKPLMVDAENWMAHPGTSRVILNIFRHSRTPGNFIILSGDVHYSFAYRIRLRYRQGGPQIWQLTDSGLKNTFPHGLLTLFDRLNRWLYAPWSPLNWFTRRRAMRVTPYIPDRSDRGERLWNGTGVGLLELDEQGRPIAIKHLNADGPVIRLLPEREQD